jgi:hypothetical protein
MLSISAARQCCDANIQIKINRLLKSARQQPELDGADKYIGLIIEPGYVI